MLKFTFAAITVFYAACINGEAAPDNLQMSFNKDMHNFWRGRKRSPDKVNSNPTKIVQNAEKTIVDVGHKFEEALRDEVDFFFGNNYNQKEISAKENKVDNFSRRSFLNRKHEVVHSDRKEQSMKKLETVSVEGPKGEEHHLTFLDVMETYADNVNRYGF